MPELIASLPHLGVRGQEAIHRALGTEIRALVEQGGVDLPRREIHEAWRVQLLEDRFALRSPERPRRKPSPRRGPCVLAPSAVPCALHSPPRGRTGSAP